MSYISFFFRVDVSSKIGLGHLIRCLSLASVVSDNAIKSHFICRDYGDYDYRLVVESGHELHLLTSSKATQLVDKNGAKNVYQTWLGAAPEVDAQEVCDIIMQTNAPQKVVICDHYGASIKWEEEVKKMDVCLLTMSDIPSRNTKADILLDPTLGRIASDYRSFVRPITQLLLGTSFSLINKVFAELRDITLMDRLKNKSAKKVLVAFGGADPLNLTSKFLDSITSYPEGLSYDVVCGSCNANLSKIENIVNSIKIKGIVINLYIDTAEMPILTAKADIGVGTAGSACWERAVLGLPSIVVASEENQRDIASALQQKKAVHIIQLDYFEASLTVALQQLSANSGYRKKLSNSSSLLCDGTGAQRVFEKIKVVLNEKI